MKLWKVEVKNPATCVGIFGRYRGCAKDAIAASTRALKLAAKEAENGASLHVESVVCLGNKDFG